jgi:two-component system OmpR family sensor kinase
MSLRLRLTLIFTALLSGIVILLSIVIYSLVSVVMTNQIDDILEQNAGGLVGMLQGDSSGEMEFTAENVYSLNTVYYQIWSEDGLLLYNSENTAGFSDAMDVQAMAGVKNTFSNVEIQGTKYRVLSVPLLIDGEESGWLQVGVTITELRSTQHMLLIVFGASAAFLILIAGVVDWLITGQILEPLEMMAKITSRITSTDDLSQRIPVNITQNDEISELILTFNKTLVRLERLFNAQRRFLADVSHELRTPLTVIKGNIGLMRMMNEFDEGSLNSVESEVDRLTRLVGDLLLMAQAETGKLPLMLKSVEMDDLLFDVFEQMKVLSGGRHDIRVESIEPAVVTGDRDRLKQVLLNLGSNAIKFSPDNGKITLALSVKDNWIRIDVRDQGPGIPAREQSRIFERFYRGDKSRTRSSKEVGFGLGLPIAYWIVISHGGRLDVESNVGEGTVFSVWLPVSQTDIPTKPL